MFIYLRMHIYTCNRECESMDVYVYEYYTLFLRGSVTPAITVVSQGKLYKLVLLFQKNTVKICVFNTAQIYA